MLSLETRQKISVAKVGKVPSQETREKMSDAKHRKKVAEGSSPAESTQWKSIELGIAI